MTNRLLNTILRKAEALTDGPTDAELLRRCGAARDAAAFATLIHRHGPMVWAVCRRMLPNPADAEDAFQAVFLAVVRSAAKLGRVNSLGGWLHGVAVRACLQLRRGAVRRKQRERASAKPEAAGAEPQWADLHAAVHEEVERLPTPLRTAFVLCELQGVRQPDAAAQLGWKLGTLSGRLTRARQQLLKNLTNRGLTPLAVAGAVGGAGLPAALADQAMALHTIGPDAVPGLSPTVLELARVATEGMMNKAKWAVGTFLLTAGITVVVGSGWLPQSNAQQPARGTDKRRDDRPSTPPPAVPAKAPPADAGEDVAPQPSPTPAKLPPRTTSAPSTAQRYEHKAMNVPANQNAFLALLRKEEEAGWEFVGQVTEREVNEPYSKLVFKRPKGGATTPTATYPTLPTGYGPASADTFPAPSSFNPLTPSSNVPSTAFPGDAAVDPRANNKPTAPANTTPAPAARNTLPPTDLAPTTLPSAPKPANNRSSKPTAGSDTPDVTVVRLKHLSAQAAHDLIAPVMGDSLKSKGGSADVVTVPDASAVVIYGADKDQIAVISALLEKLDVASPTSGAKK